MTSFLLGLTGGIGSGKSTVGQILTDLGAFVVDADQLAREVVAPGQPALREIVDRWGSGVLLEDGSLNRTALATIVFADPLERAALEAMTHPRIVAESDRLLAASDASVGVHMAALLFEAGATARLQAIWLVTAPEAVRIARVMARDNVPEALVRARIAHQWTDERKAALANVVIDTDSTLEALQDRVTLHWSHLIDAVRRGIAPYPTRTP